MYLLHKMREALTDLLSACHSRYPDGAAHAAHAVNMIVHRLHQTRQPDCEMARKPWLLAGEPLLPLCCRVLAALYQLRQHEGLSGLSYDADWIERIVTNAVRYLDHLIGPPGDPAAPVPVVLPPDAPGGASGVAPPCGPCRTKTPHLDPTRN